MFKKFSFLLALVIAIMAAWILPVYANHIFTVINHSSEKVMKIQISPENQNRWGPNLLGIHTLPRGAQLNFNLTQGCYEDARILYSNGVTEWHRNIDTCSGNLVLTYSYP